MQNNTIIGNIGIFDTEFDMNGLAKLEGINGENVKLQVGAILEIGALGHLRAPRHPLSRQLRL